MSSSEESSEASASPSPPASPEASNQQLLEPPSLERLVLHFIHAKRSLSASALLSRVGELVTGSRSLLEEIAVLNARNAFARRAVDEQVETLAAIRHSVGDVGDSATDEFQNVVDGVDEAHGRLERTLAGLKGRVVDAELQRTGNSEENETEEQSEPTEKTLYDFIQESTHTDLEASIRGLVDEFGVVKNIFDRDLRQYDGYLSDISDTLQHADLHSTSGPQAKQTLYDDPTPSIPKLFRAMDGHAAQTAELFSSLIKHYDLCVTALKHTEGGGEAAKQAVQAEHLSSQSPAGGEESLYKKTVPEPIDEDERKQMLRVVEGDASEVEDVLNELHELSEEVESSYEQLHSSANHARSTHSSLHLVLGKLHEIKSALPSHLEAAKSFRSSWDEIRSSIASKTRELASLASFYDDFSAAYSKVLREVDRRNAAEAQARKLAAKAQRELDKLYEADKEAREDFLEDVGGSLPRDIWPRAGDGGYRWEVRQITKR
ncbi:hypothetical protein NU219Hw_g6674t1 [Hortaea werneckii]